MVTTKEIEEGIRTQSEKIEKIQKKWLRTGKGRYEAKIFQGMWGVAFKDYDEGFLYFNYSGIGNVDTVALTRQLNNVLRPFKLKVKTLRVFCPETNSRNVLQFWAELKKIK
jgi:hypothetical protein